ncbi:DNA replication/repair protein RecF [Crenothrix sp.]|uniref:DNA replication/repair protein RecF n=1 Tax=Crenothrix sp. TaxID=3100433 RepID=UPI00374DA266
MALLKLNICGVRNLCRSSITFSTAINFFYGENGSGKSALLESIFLLGRARSFRTSVIKSIINSDKDQITISGIVARKNGNTFSLGLQLADKKNVIQVNHHGNQKRSDLAYALPIQLIYPKSYQLLDSSSQIRREFLDWGVFNSNDSFLIVWKRFRKALTYRNFLLKKNAPKQLDAWNDELVAYGVELADFREQYLNKLNPVFMSVIQQFFDGDPVELKHFSGWGEAVTFSQALSDDLAKDLRYGFTHSGPHRGDFQVMFDGRLAKNYVSRGQLKLIVISLLLAQVQLIITEGGVPPCVLIDDFAAELDIKNRKKILNYLAHMNCQVFMTAIEMADFGSLNSLQNYKMFHVEHGNVTAV